MKRGSASHALISVAVAVMYAGAVNVHCNVQPMGSDDEAWSEATEHDGLAAPAFTPLLSVTPSEALKPGPYSFDVTATGEAVWQMPLWIPEGRNGIAPRLSITYASKRG